MNEPVNRSEFELFVKTYEIQRQELRLETKEFETDIKAQMNTLNNKMDTISIQMSKRNMDVWKIIATSSASLIVGYLASTLRRKST